MIRNIKTMRAGPLRFEQGELLGAYTFAYLTYDGQILIHLSNEDIDSFLALVVDLEEGKSTAIRGNVYYQEHAEVVDDNCVTRYVFFSHDRVIGVLAKQDVLFMRKMIHGSAH